MIEIAESKNLEKQVTGILLGKEVKKVYNASSPHKFCWYYDDPLKYDELLRGQIITNSKGHGMYLDIYFDTMTLAVCDGANLRYYDSIDLCPEKYQLLIQFTDNSAIAITIAMYGGIFVFRNNENKNKYYLGSFNSISPLDERFTKDYFLNLFNKVEKDISIKALLATEQRIPGLGNGSIQDILICSGLHPKRKVSTINQSKREDLLYNLKAILLDIYEKGGRDTEKDLFGNYGRYETILSKKSFSEPCKLCGDKIVKEAYLGGSIYYCPSCQKLD